MGTVTSKLDHMVELIQKLERSQEEDKSFKGLVQSLNQEVRTIHSQVDRHDGHLSALDKRVSTSSSAAPTSIAAPTSSSSAPASGFGSSNSTASSATTPQFASLRVELLRLTLSRPRTKTQSSTAAALVCLWEYRRDDRKDRTDSHGHVRGDHDKRHASKGSAEQFVCSNDTPTASASKPPPSSTADTLRPNQRSIWRR